jgi:hypothetical protein
VNDSTNVGQRCRNCGAPIDGRYCASCGQETKLALPTAREFLREAAGRYVALDGRLWRSLFALFARPGFLTREYFEGRRRRYIRPSRLFLVLSLALFGVLRVVAEGPLFITSDGAQTSLDAGSAAADLNRDLDELGLDNKLDIDFGDSQWARDLRKRVQRFNAMSRQDKADQLFAGVLRYGPYAMFALLPGFALLLQAVYAGRRRVYPVRPRRYAQHLVFAAHNHAFLCLVAILIAAVPIGVVRIALAVWASVYFAWSMRTVYGGRWSGVFARSVVLYSAYSILFAIATAGLIAAAAVLR